MPQKDHAQAARELEEQANSASGDQAKFYREAARLVRNPQLQKALDELGANPSARGQAKQNPKAYLKGKGVDLPDELQVDVTE